MPAAAADDDDTDADDADADDADDADDDDDDDDATSIKTKTTGDHDAPCAAWLKVDNETGDWQYLLALRTLAMGLGIAPVTLTKPHMQREVVSK